MLNIDASGNPSQIYGNLISTAGAIAAVGPLPACGACNSAPAIFLSNANGIVVGTGGRIVAPAGVGLIAADLDGNLGTSINDFIGNNNWTNPPAPQAAAGPSYLGFSALPSAGATPGLVEIGGAINGDFVANEPAKYILVAGNNVHVTNTGNLFGNKVVIDAGVIATTSKGTINGVTNVAVNRLWNVDIGAEMAWSQLGSASNQLTLAGPAGNGNITNDGSISARGMVVGDYISLVGSGNITSGTDGSNDAQVGLFSDLGIWIDALSADKQVSIYNVVSGYTTNKTLPFLYINYYASNQNGSGTATAVRSNVLVKAITPGVQPSSITTLYGVGIYGADVTIASTINHKSATNKGVNGEYDLVLDASKKLTVSADVGAGQDVYLVAGTEMVISGNVLSDANENGSGGIYGFGGTGTTTVTGNLTALGSDDIHFDVYNEAEFAGTISANNGGDVIIDNFGTGAGNKTVISGDIMAAAGGVYITQSLSGLNAPIEISGDVTANGNVVVTNAGASAGNTTTISGDLTAINGSVLVTHSGLLTGMLEVSGSMNAGTAISILTDGSAKIAAATAPIVQATVGGLALEVNGPWSAGVAGITSPLSNTTFTPDGTVTAPVINLSGLNFRSVDASGAAFADAADKPVSQFWTQDLNVTLTGTMNAPIAGNTNWPLNSFDVSPILTLAPVFVSVTANGGGFQAVNIRVLGNEIFDTGGTTTPFIGVPTTTGGFPAGGLQGNLGSQLIIQADGSLILLGTSTGSLFGPANAIQWPGGATFVAGTTLQMLAPFYNAWSIESPPYGGVFFTAPVIALNNYIATSGTAWANFSSEPVTGNPVVYQIRQLGTNAFGFQATESFVKNDYMQTVVGGPVCTVLGPTTWTACP